MNYTSNAIGATADIDVQPLELTHPHQLVLPHKLRHFDRTGKEISIASTGMSGALPLDGMPPSIAVTNGEKEVLYVHYDNAHNIPDTNFLKLQLGQLRAEYIALKNEHGWILSEMCALDRRIASSWILNAAHAIYDWLHPNKS